MLLLLLLLILSTSPWGLSELLGGGFPTSDIDHSGPRIRRLLLLLIYPSAPPFPSPVYGSFIPFLPPLRPIPYLPPSFTHRHQFSLFLHPLLLPPYLVRLRGNCPPGWRSCPPDATACLHYPPMLGGPNEFLAQAVHAFYRLVVLSCCPRPVPRSLSTPGFYRPTVPSSLFLTPSPSHPLVSPACLGRRPSNLSIPGGGVAFFIPPSSFIPSRPPRVLRRLLVSSEVWFLSGVLLREKLRPGRLHFLEIYRPSPCSCATRPCRSRSGSPAPRPLLPPSISPPCSHDTIPVSRIILGGFVRSQSNPRIDQSW